MAKEFKGKDVEKGIAVPTCVSVNNCVGHYSPLNDNTTELKEGDVVKMCVRGRGGGVFWEA